MRARGLTGVVLVAATAWASPPFKPLPSPLPVTRTSSPQLRWTMNPPGCPGLELMLFEVQLIEGGGKPKRYVAAAAFDEVRAKVLVAVPQACDGIPALVIPPQRGLALETERAFVWPSRRMLEASATVSAGASQFVFGWKGESKRVSIDLQSGEARLEDDGAVLASAGRFREAVPLVPPAYTRHWLNVRLPGAVSPPTTGPGRACIRYFDLAIEEVFVVRRVTIGEVLHDQLVLGAGFLRSETLPAEDCRVRDSATDVHLELDGAFVLEPFNSSSSATFGIQVTGFDRVSRRFLLAPGTSVARLVISGTEVVDVDLERGTANVVRESPPRLNTVAGPFDFRQAWQVRDRDQDLYRRQTFLRSHNTRDGEDLCDRLNRELRPDYIPGGEAEALWELHAALNCARPGAEQ